MPISRKDAALNSLVNFSNLAEDKKKEEDAKAAADYKPLVIDPKQAAGSGFVPGQMPTADPLGAPVAAIEQAQLPKSQSFEPQADILEIAKKESATYGEKSPAPVAAPAQSNSSA